VITLPWSKDKRRPHKRKHRILAKKDPQPIPEWLAARIAEADVIIGADECGWGCVAGPVVVAACILPKDYNGPRIRDSKKYGSERSREEAEKAIKEHAFRYEIAPVSAFAVGHFGPAATLDLAYRTALDKVLDGTEYKNPLIIIDGSRKIVGFERKHYAIPKGDDRVQAIAAASVLGKCWRDRYMTELDQKFPEFKFSTHKGYPTGAHYEEIRRYGVTLEHRRNIEYVKEMLEKVGKYGHGSSQGA